MAALTFSPVRSPLSAAQEITETSFSPAGACAAETLFPLPRGDILRSAFICFFPEGGGCARGRGHGGSGGEDRQTSHLCAWKHLGLANTGTAPSERRRGHSRAVTVWRVPGRFTIDAETQRRNTYAFYHREEAALSGGRCVRGGGVVRSKYTAATSLVLFGERRA